VATLVGHKGTINTPAFNQDSSLLASRGIFWVVYKLNVILGSDRIVKIWDTRISKDVQMIRDPNGQWGQITCQSSSSQIPAVNTSVLAQAEAIS
jgi:WD40 repeat protein